MAGPYTSRRQQAIWSHVLFRVKSHAPVTSEDHCESISMEGRYMTIA